jgi:hypothetical protein
MWGSQFWLQPPFQAARAMGCNIGKPFFGKSEQNPVMAGSAATAEQFRWSSAKAA